jgi:hypothetical protein
VDDLRRKKILSPDNRTDPGKGIYECETGQITLDTGKKYLMVQGKNISGVCMDKLDSPLEVEDLRVESASVSASITVAALDDSSIAASKRLLIVVATDARNSNETYDAANHAVLNKLGNLPVLMRTGRFSIALRRDVNSPELQAWTLALDGIRKEPLTVKLDQGWLRLDFDTSILSKGPSPFIELIRNE